MTSLATKAAQLFATHLPARNAHCELSLAPRPEGTVWSDEKGFVFVSLRLAIFDPDDARSVLDVKEQELCLPEITAHAEPRALAYLEGHLRALPALLDHWGDRARYLMPMDVFGHPEALADGSLESADDFARAFGDSARVQAWHETRDRTQWEEDLAACGLRDQVDEVRVLERASIRLHLDVVDHDDDDGYDDGADAVDEHADEARAIGKTRVGGEPDLPPSMPWPESNGEPLAFVAQLDLESLAKFPAAAELPRTGVLSFFYSQNPVDGVRGNPVRVIHLTDATNTLARRKCPDDVERVPSHVARAAAERMLPPIESPFYEALLSGDSQRTFRSSLLNAGRGGAGRVVDPLAGIGNFIVQRQDIDPERPMNRVLGYASSIQGDPYVDVEIDAVRNGYEGWVDDSDEAIALRRSARRWRLLLQIDASGDGELVLNQDGGFFYFWITEEALAARDWAQVRGSLQCH